MRIDWNTSQVIAELGKMYRGATDPYATGWNNWPCKQDLYRVKFALDDMLSKTAKFAGEEEWLEEQRIEREKQKVWRTLNETHTK